MNALKSEGSSMHYVLIAFMIVCAVMAGVALLPAILIVAVLILLEYAFTGKSSLWGDDTSRKK